MKITPLSFFVGLIGMVGIWSAVLSGGQQPTPTASGVRQAPGKAGQAAGQDRTLIQTPTPTPGCIGGVMMCVPKPPADFADYETIIYEKGSKCWHFKKGGKSFASCEPLK